MSIQRMSDMVLSVSSPLITRNSTKKRKSYIIDRRFLRLIFIQIWRYTTYTRKRRSNVRRNRRTSGQIFSFKESENTSQRQMYFDGMPESKRIRLCIK